MHTRDGRLLIHFSFLSGLPMKEVHEEDPGSLPPNGFSILMNLRTTEHQIIVSENISDAALLILKMKKQK